MNPKVIKRNYRFRSLSQDYDRRAELRQNRDYGDTELRSHWVNEDQHLHLGGVFMEIKFKKMEEFKRGNYDMVAVVGEALTGKRIGEDYKATFFKTQKEMLEVVKAAKPGDKLNITMKKNGQYWNPVKIKNEGAASSTSANNFSTDAPAPANDRVIAAQISAQVTAACVIGGITEDDDITEVLIKTLSNANVVEDYINKRGPFAFDGAKSHDIPDDGMKDAKDDSGDETADSTDE